MEVKDSGVDGGTVCMVMFSFPETGLCVDSGIFDVDPVALLEHCRALKPTLLEHFRALKSDHPIGAF